MPMMSSTWAKFLCEICLKEKIVETIDWSNRRSTKYAEIERCWYLGLLEENSCN